MCYDIMKAGFTCSCRTWSNICTSDLGARCWWMCAEEVLGTSLYWKLQGRTFLKTWGSSSSLQEAEKTWQTAGLAFEVAGAKAIQPDADEVYLPFMQKQSYYISNTCWRQRGKIMFVKSSLLSGFIISFFIPWYFRKVLHDMLRKLLQIGVVRSYTGVQLWYLCTSIGQGCPIACVYSIKSLWRMKGSFVDGKRLLNILGYVRMCRTLRDLEKIQFCIKLCFWMYSGEISVLKYFLHSYFQ